MLVSRSRYAEMERERDFYRAAYFRLLETPHSPVPPVSEPIPADPDPRLPAPIEEQIEDRYGSPNSPLARQVRRAVRSRFPGGWEDGEVLKQMRAYVIRGEDVPA